MVNHLMNTHEYGGILSVAGAISDYYSEQDHNFADHLTFVHAQNRFVDETSNVSTHHLPVKIKSTKDIPKLDDLREAYEPVIDSMREILLSEKTDVVSCNGTFYYPWLLFNAAEREDIPCIVTYDGIIEMEETDEVSLQIGKEFTNPEKYAYIFPSNLAKQTAEDIKEVKFTNSLVSPNGINADLCDLTYQGKEKSKDFSIGFIGRMKEVKNPRYLARLSTILEDSGIDANISCVCDLSKLNSTGYSRQVTRELTESGVEFVDLMSQPQLSGAYRNTFDMVVSPSTFETYGNVPLESIVFSNGKTPAVISENMGVSEVYRRFGLTDLIVNFNDDNSVIEVIKRIKDGDLRIDKEVIDQIRNEYAWPVLLKKREEFRSTQAN